MSSDRPLQSISPIDYNSIRSIENINNSILNETITEPFDLLYFSDKKYQNPIHLHPLELDVLPLINSSEYPFRVMHYCIKDATQDEYHIEEITEKVPAILPFISACIDAVGSYHKGRFAYLTLHPKKVKKNQTHRSPGWHVDGLQGDEVPEKQPGDLNFLWCNILGTEYTCRSFDMKNVSLSTHNIFEHLGKQIDKKTEYFYPGSMIENHILLCNSYLVHRSPIAKEDIDRCFVRLCYSHVPITNTKMSINPYINYSYKIHTSGGMIPEHLKK